MQTDKPSPPMILLLLIIPLASSANFPIVHTSYGAVRGYEYRAENGFVGEIFKKIPFAAPPTGERRWKKPEPPESWNYTLDGTFFGPGCAQVSAGDRWKGYVTGLSEDCLTLNVYTSKACRESNASCPVVFYIHGGSAVYSGTLLFPDETLVTNYPTQGVIMVTMAYRLGVFGELALGDENALPTNLAMHDLLESLRFVRQEIHNFGGDKEQITVMGTSTGATFALLLTFSPTFNKPGEPPLFSRAIAMSPSGCEYEEKQVNRSHVLAAHLGCTGTAQEIMNCLQPLSTETIIKGATEMAGPDPSGPDQISGIVLGGELLPIHNLKELRENQNAHMEQLSLKTKLMIGTAVNEFDFDVLSAANPDFPKVTDVLGVRNADEITKKYFSDVNTGKFEPGYNPLSQSIFLTSSLFASAHAKAGGEVFLYQYDYPQHANHADDRYYVMGRREHPKDENEEWLSRIYPIYFTNFIKGLPLAPDWTPLDPALMNYYSINKSFTDGISPKMELGYHQSLSNYYDDMMAFDENLILLKKKLLNTSVQIKGLTIVSMESFHLLDLLIYTLLVVVIVFILYNIYRFCKSSRTSVEASSLLPDRDGLSITKSGYVVFS